jgi:hypothetical protein
MELGGLEPAVDEPGDNQMRPALIERAYLLAFSRLPDADEQAEATRFLETQGRPSDTHAALVDFCHALLNSNEFLFLE